jgi:hypothetical protein
MVTINDERISHMVTEQWWAKGIDAMQDGGTMHAKQCYVFP